MWRSNKCGFKGISLLAKSDSDKCLVSRIPLTHSPNIGQLMPPNISQAQVLRLPVSTVRGLDEKKMYFHLLSQIVKLPSSKGC